MQSAQIDRYLINGEITLPEEMRDFPGPLHIIEKQNLYSLGNLRSVRGGLYLWDCENLNSFGDLKSLDGPLDCRNCPRLTTVGKLRHASGFVNLESTSVKELAPDFRLDAILPTLKPLRLLAAPMPH